MFKSIMVPVDLAHQDRLGGAITAAADLAKIYDARVCYVGATTGTPSAIAHNPKEFGEKLDAFAQTQATLHGHEATSHVIISHDPATNLDHDLVKAVSDVGADVVVMATHLPRIADLIWPSNGGRLATHTDVSVFLVRADASK